MESTDQNVKEVIPVSILFFMVFALVAALIEEIVEIVRRKMHPIRRRPRQHIFN